MEDEGFEALFITVADRPFAVEVGQVQALRRKEALYPAQDGPPDLQGFLRLGGKAVPVLDLGVRLGLQDSEVLRMGLIIVAASELAPLAFRVDQIEGTKAVSWSSVALLPKMLQALQPRAIVWGLIRREDTLVPLLDIDQLVSPEEVETFQGIGRTFEGGSDDGNDGS